MGTSCTECFLHVAQYAVCLKNVLVSPKRVPAQHNKDAKVTRSWGTWTEVRSGHDSTFLCSSFFLILFLCFYVFTFIRFYVLEFLGFWKFWFLGFWVLRFLGFGVSHIRCRESQSSVPPTPTSVALSWPCFSRTLLWAWNSGSASRIDNRMLWQGWIWEK